MEYLVLRTLFTLAFLLGVAVGPVVAGPGGLFVTKPKVDEAKALTLIETLKSDPDEKKRKAAAAELSGADARTSPDVATALVAALRKDTSASVRVEAADAIRHLGETFPHAGFALEVAVESDPSLPVRLAAKRALWEYHLNGYRTAKGTDGSAGQTIEPPIASPDVPRPAVALIPAPPAPVSVSVGPIVGLPTGAAQQVPPPGLGLFWPNVLPGPRTAIRTALNLALPPVLNMTSEPPLAKKLIGPPSVTAEGSTAPPPKFPMLPMVESLSPGYVPTLPPFQPELPSVVTPPGK